ncbi:MAG: pyrroline-5-carboxylate reductase [Burkholderiaceae bacterium]|nr:pyrroline-5-carboxylate reductase [Burkholderiaceae bacterium]
MNQTHTAAVTNTSPPERIAFLGGGNMASAMIGGLLKQGMSPDNILVVEPYAPTRDKLFSDFGITAQDAPSSNLVRAGLVVWAVKPQVFKEAAQQIGAFAPAALHFSVAAGIRTDSIAAWLGSERIVRAMPNTPALIGKGMTALFARPAVEAAGKAWVERVVASMGEYLWLDAESKLDAVTAISGSGPAYVFYFLEAMTEAAVKMGLSPEQGRQLAIATFSGASELAQRSDEPLETLRQRVTSKGGTTYAALSSMENDDIKHHFIRAMQAAQQRARELGDEFGGT